MFGCLFAGKERGLCFLLFWDAKHFFLFGLWNTVRILFFFVKDMNTWSFLVWVFSRSARARHVETSKRIYTIEKSGRQAVLLLPLLSKKLTRRLSLPSKELTLIKGFLNFFSNAAANSLSWLVARSRLLRVQRPLRCCEANLRSVRQNWGSSEVFFSEPWPPCRCESQVS